MPNKNRTSRVLSVRHARNDERVAKPQKADSCAPAQEKRRIVRIEKKKEKFVSTFRKRLGSLWWQILLPRSIQQSSSNKLFHNKNWERTLRSRFHKKGRIAQYQFIPWVQCEGQKPKRKLQICFWWKLRYPELQPWTNSTMRNPFQPSTCFDPKVGPTSAPTNHKFRGFGVLALTVGALEWRKKTVHSRRSS